MRKLILAVSLTALMTGSAFGIDENAGTSAACFLKVGLSVRSAGMGGAGVALAEGVDGLSLNPAALVGLKSKEVLLMHHSYLEEVSFNYLAGILPLKNQGVGVGLNLISTGNIKRTTYNIPDGNGELETGGMILTAGYARNISKQIKAGASLKYISQKLDDKTGKGAGLDIGLLYQPRIKGLTLGAVVENIGLKKIKFIEEKEDLPLLIKAGAGYKIKKALVGIDIAKSNDNSIQFNLGGQYQIIPSLALRAGYNSSIDEGPGVTAGFGISHKNLTFDGAYLPAGEFDSTFQLSASMRF
ncbi:PorV/PorQ family protein [bacterium]|nr:PorV/PorQ family protein [bacterium]MBU1616016.1 PorV/PorQ family protein [bacterium]